MLTLKELQAQYITNDVGEKTAVILPIKSFEELLSDLQDLALVAERRDEETISHSQLLDELKQDGII